MNKGTREFGIGLLVVEAWFFAVVGLACLPRHRSYWLFVLPYLLLVPPTGVLRESFPGWKGVLAVGVGWMSAALIAFSCRPFMMNGLIGTVLSDR